MTHTEVPSARIVKRASGNASSIYPVAVVASAKRIGANAAKKASPQWRSDGRTNTAIAATTYGEGPPSLASGAAEVCCCRRLGVDLSTVIRVAKRGVVSNGS